MECLKIRKIPGEIYIGCGFIRRKLAGIYCDVLRGSLWSPVGESLPLHKGGFRRQARRNLFSPIIKKKQPFGCFFLVGPAGFGPAGCGSQSPVPYRLATAQSISQGIPE